MSGLLCLDPPEIDRPPMSQKVKAGGIAAFYCYATGQPSPNFTWKKNGKKLRYTDSRYLISDFDGGSLLRIEPVRKKRDEGEVECVAENAHGDPVSAKASLTIYDGRFYQLEVPIYFLGRCKKSSRGTKKVFETNEHWLGGDQMTVHLVFH